MKSFGWEGIISNQIETVKERSKELGTRIYTTTQKERGKVMHVLSLYLWQLVSEEIEWLEEEERGDIEAMRQVISQIKSYVAKHPLQKEEPIDIVLNVKRVSPEEGYRLCALLARRLQQLYPKYTLHLLFYKVMRYTLAQKEALYDEGGGWVTIEDIPITVQTCTNDEGKTYIKVLDPYNL